MPQCNDETFHDWLSTCPTEFEVLNHDFGACSVHFSYEEDSDDEEE